MICDKITYKKQDILTIYHKGLDDSVKDRSIKTSTKIGRYNLVFSETYVDDSAIENIKDYTYKEEGLLPPRAAMNPYGDSACANMIHYTYTNKPDSLFSFDGSYYSIKLPTNIFLEISEFIKKYTGIDIQTTPMICGDILVYKNIERNFRANKTTGIILENLPANALIIINFKSNNTIVSSKVIKLSEDTKKLEVNSDKTWKSHDIQIFKDEELIYYQRDVAYIRHITLKSKIKSTGKSVQLSKIGTSYVETRESSLSASEIGEPIDKFEEIMNTSNNKIKRFIKTEHPDDKVVFIKHNELDKAKQYIIDIFEKAKDEIWIFDPYFTDSNEISKIIDWLKIFTISNRSKKNIVFYCDPQKKKTLCINDFIAKIKSDTDLAEIIRVQKLLNITCYQVALPIHDRFILVKNDNEYFGLSIGTSFNSLERNCFCIHKLSHASSKFILNELINWMSNGNILDDEEV